MINKKTQLSALAITALIGFQVARAPQMENRTSQFEQKRTHLQFQTAPSQNKVPVMTLGTTSGLQQNEVEMINDSFVKANQALASECFKDKVLNATFTENNDLTSAQIYTLLVNQPIVVGVEMFSGSFAQNYIYKTMGYDVGDGIAYMNRHFVKDSSTAASVEVHEGEGHGQGFHHYQVFASSVPYQFNDFIDTCIGQK
jgi:hypothetical protein